MRDRRAGGPGPLVRPLLLALALGAVVAVVAGILLPRVGGVEVLVLSRDVSAGAVLTEGDLRRVRVPERMLARDAVRDPALVGEAPVPVSLAEGTVLTESLLAGSPAGRELDEGMTRLSLTLPADQVASVGVGDSVELWSLPHGCEQDLCRASLIATQVRIASVDGTATGTWSGPSTLHVEVVAPSDETEDILGAAGGGTLAVVLRAPAARTTD